MGRQHITLGDTIQPITKRVNFSLSLFTASTPPPHLANCASGLPRIGALGKRRQGEWESSHSPASGGLFCTAAQRRSPPVTAECSLQFPLLGEHITSRLTGVLPLMPQGICENSTLSC